LAALPEDERIRSTLADAAKIHPAVVEHFEQGATVCWDENRWARGAYAWFKPGEMFSLRPHVAPPEGRVHFAGEHASASPGWMQGALEAGNRAAQEVNDAPASRPGS
jgi:monoamine oxidase